MADPSFFVGRVVELPTRSSDKNLAVVSTFDYDTFKFTLMFASSGKREDIDYEEFGKKIQVLSDAEGERRLAQRGMRKVEGYGVYGTRKLNSVNGRLVVINDPALIQRFGGRPSNKTMVVKTVPASEGRIQVMTPSGAKKAMKAADFATGKLVLHDPKNRSDLVAQFEKQTEETTRRTAAKKKMNRIGGVAKKKKPAQRTVAQAAAVRVRPGQKEEYKRLSDEVQKKENEIKRVLMQSNRTQNQRQVVNQGGAARLGDRQEAAALAATAPVSAGGEVGTLEKQLERLLKRKERLITRKRLSKNVLQKYIAQKVNEKNVKELKRVYATDFEYYAMQGAGTDRRGFGRTFNRAEALKTAIEAEREKVQKWSNANVRDAITSQLDKRAMEVDADMQRAGKKLQELTNKEARRRTRPRGRPTPRAKLQELKLQLLTAPPTLQAKIQKQIENFKAFQKKTQRTLKPLPPNRVFKNKQSKQNNQTGVDTGEFISDELLDKMKMHFAQQAKRRGVQTKKLLNVARKAHEGLKTTLITQHAQKALPGVTKADQRLRVRLMNVASKNPSYFVIRKGGLYLSQKAQKMIRELRKRVLQGNAGYVASPVRELAKVRKMSNVGSFGYDLKYPIELEYRTTAADATRKHKKNKTTSKDSLNLALTLEGDRADGTTPEGAVKLLKILGKMGVHTGKPVGKILKGQPLSDAVAILEALPQDKPTMYSSRPRKVVRPVGMETAAKRGYTEEFYTTKSQDKIRSSIVTAFIKALTYQSCGCELSDPGARLVRSRSCDERLPLNYDDVPWMSIAKLEQEEGTLLKRSYPLIGRNIPKRGQENEFTKMFYEITDSDPESLGRVYESNRAYMKNVVMPSLAIGLKQLMKKYRLRDTDLDPVQNNRPTATNGPQAATGGVNRGVENRAALARGNIANRANSTSTAVNLVLGSCDRGLDLLLRDDIFTLRNGPGLSRGTGSYKLLRHVHEQYGPIMDFKIKNGDQQKSYLANVGISIAFLFFNGVNGQTVRDALYALYRMHIFCRYVYSLGASWCQDSMIGSFTGYAIPLAKAGNQARTPRQILYMIMEGKLEEADKFKYKVKDTPTMDSDKSDSALIRIFSFLQLAASEVITESEIMLFLETEFNIFYQGNLNAEENPLKYHSNLVAWIKQTPKTVINSLVTGRVCLPVLLADPELSASLSRTAAQYHLVTNGLELVAEYRVAHKKSELFDRLRAEMRTLANLKNDRNKAQQFIKDTTAKQKKTTNRRQINTFEKQLKDRRETLRKLNGRINRASQELNDKSKYKDYSIRLSDDFTNVLRDAESRGAITMNEKQNSSRTAIELLFQHVKSRKNSNLQDVKLSFVDSSNRDKYTSTKELVFYAAAPKPTTQMTPDEARAWFKKALKVQAVLPATARGCDTKSGSRNVKRTTGFATPQMCLSRKLSVLHNMEIRPEKPISLGAMTTQQFTTEQIKSFNTKRTMPWLIPREHRFNSTQVSENQKRAWMNYLFALHEWLPENTSGKLKYKNTESWESYGRRVLERRGPELNALDKKLRPDPTVPPQFTDEMKQTAKKLFPKLQRTSGIANRFKD